MANADCVTHTTDIGHSHPVNIRQSQPFLKCLKCSINKTFFPDDFHRQFKNQTPFRRFVLGLQYFLPILQWAPSYNLHNFKADLIAGITNASFAIPQGITYYKLANLPPILDLYSSFVPPLVYAIVGNSRELAVGTVAVASLLMDSMLSNGVDANQQPELYYRLVFTATFFAGVFQASVGLLRLGFVVDFLSHATIVGLMAGAATVVSIQQLKGILGLDYFTDGTDLVSIMRSIFSQTHLWRCESGVLGCCVLFFLIFTKHFIKTRRKLFWVSAVAPLSSIILGSLLIHTTDAKNHGVEVIGPLKKGLNPLSWTDLDFGSPYLATAIKTGFITGVIALVEGIAVGRSSHMFKDNHIQANKEIVAFGVMNIAGSCTSCYLSTGLRSTMNYSTGCKTAASNIVMATAVMITLLFLMPLFHYTPLAVLSSIKIAAMLSLMDYKAAIHLWEVDKFDFIVCLGGYIGVVFGSVELGLVIAVAISILRVLLFIARPGICVLGKIPNSMIYRSIDQYPHANSLAGVLVLQINAPIYFANISYVRERISRWIDDEEEKLKSSGENSLQYIILNLGTIGSIDTSGISMLEEVKENIDRRGIKLVLANPGNEVMKKLDKSKFIENMGQEWIFLTVGEAVKVCKRGLVTVELGTPNNNEP